MNIIRKFGVVNGLTNQPIGLDVGLSGGSNIKSIQRGTGSIGSGLAQIDVTITAIDLTKSVVKVTYLDTANSAAYASCVKAEFTSSTNLRLTRGGSTAQSTAVEWEIIEYYSLKSLQTGTLATDGTSLGGTVSITSVDLSKAVLFFTFNNGGTTTTISSGTMTGKLSSSTLITFVNSSEVGSRSIFWFVVEFN